MEKSAPARVMYVDLKSFAGINHAQAAEILLSDRPRAGGRSLRAHALEDPTFRTREIVKAEPGAYAERDFSSFSTSALTITRRMIARLGGADARERIARHYLTETLGYMCDALDSNGCNGILYANAVEHVASMTLANERDRACVYVMLFIATGCLGDPSRAFELVEEFAHAKLSGAFHTQMDADDPAPERVTPPDTILVLYPEVAPGIFGQPLPLDPEGTEIGRLAAGPSDISDVPIGVSRHHLRIWREGGRWYCEGLKSTNGTVLVSGDDRSEVVVEPPEHERPRDWRGVPHELRKSDRLCLGARMSYLVGQIATS